MVIGITGTLGAGKGAVVDFLTKKYGFKHFSARDFLSKKILEKNLEINRDTLTETANGLRQKHGSAYVVEELYKEAETAGGNAVIESVRTIGEIVFLRSKENFVLIAVDADPKLRYGRVVGRKSETDKISFEKFVEDEAREMHSKDVTKQNLSACIDLADLKIMNNGTLEKLEKEIIKIVKSNLIDI